MKSKKWNIARPNIGAIRSLAKTCGYAPLTAAVLCARGLDTPEKAQTFLAHDLSGLHDPFLLPDMHAAVEAIDNAIANGEHIAVFGDYDVDGITSTCVLVRYLKSRGAACRYYIPDRLSEGYGLNKPALLKLRDSGVSMVITVDSGITAVEEIAYANEIGLKVVVTDHHECKDDLPDAVAVVNPKRTDSTYPFKDLAGVGVVFKLVCALEGPENLEQVVTTYLDLVAVGTIADVMRLQGENRVIVTYGLLLLQQTDNPGLRMLMREAGVETRRMTASVVSFTLAPRINAAGRMGCADEAAQLFLTDSPSYAQEIAALLCCQNKERQNAENEILRQAYEVLQKEYDPQEDRMIVLWGENSAGHPPKILRCPRWYIPRAAREPLHKHTFFAAVRRTKTQKVLLRSASDDAAESSTLCHTNVRCFRLDPPKSALRYDAAEQYIFRYIICRHQNWQWPLRMPTDMLLPAVPDALRHECPCRRLRPML